MTNAHDGDFDSILDDENLKEKVLDTIKIFDEKLSNRIYHCYNTNEN